MSALTGEAAGPPTVGKDPRSPQLRSSADRRWDRVRWVLLVCWLVVGVTTAVTGERVASWQQVRALVAHGEVDTVRVAGELPAHGTGYRLVEVHWRHGLTRYTAEVYQVRGSAPPGREAATGAAPPLLHQAPSARLATLQPAVQIVREQGRSTGHARLFGWQVPTWLGLFAALLFFAGLGVLVAGPEPWRASRWAWLWLSLPPVGGIVFLLAAGPTSGCPGPRDPRRRLSGGWAFLLSLPLMAVLGPYRG